METLIFGLTVTLIGMVIVFAGLMLLIGLIKLVAIATGGIGQKPKKDKKADEPAPVIQAPAVQPVAAPAPAADEQLIAVISAAVAAMLGEECGFVVRRVRRVTNASPWQKAGREEQIYSRF